jgi:hypothetical protein
MHHVINRATGADATAHKPKPLYGNYNTSVLSMKKISPSLNVCPFTKIYCIQDDNAKQFMTTKLLVFAPGLHVLPSVQTLLGRNQVLCKVSWISIYVYWDRSKHECAWFKRRWKDEAFGRRLVTLNNFIFVGYMLTIRLIHVVGFQNGGDVETQDTCTGVVYPAEYGCGRRLHIMAADLGHCLTRILSQLIYQETPSPRRHTKLNAAGRLTIQRCIAASDLWSSMMQGV